MIPRAQPRESLIVLAALAALAGLSWWLLFAVPMPMPGPAGVRSATYVGLTVLMWVVMMIAMMTPAVAPVVMLFDRSQGRSERALHGRTWAFVTGYFTAWVLFSLLVALLQIALIDITWVDTMMVSQKDAFSGALLVAVGVYQWLPAKSACLEHCRNPVRFLQHHYRPALLGAWRMGAAHGAYCVGCCALLMLALFVGGVMNPLWIVGITGLVAIEKLLPRGPAVGRAMGLLLLVAGVVVLLRA